MPPIHGIIRAELRREGTIPTGGGNCNVGDGSGHFPIGGKGGNNFWGHTHLKNKVKCRDPTISKHGAAVYGRYRRRQSYHTCALPNIGLVWCHVWWLGRLRSWLDGRRTTKQRLSLLEASFWYVIPWSKRKNGKNSDPPSRTSQSDARKYR